MALRELRIANVVVVAGARITPGDGFTVLTGETGAGKSVCVNALRAVLGARSEQDMVRGGAECAEVAAVFDDVPLLVQTRLAELGVPADDLLTLTRQIPRGGRGAFRINGALVSQSVAREVGEQLVDVTTQGASQRLLRRSVQRRLLDAASGETARSVSNSLATAVGEWREAVEHLDARRRAAAATENELRAARDAISELTPLQLRTDEEAELMSERTRLRHAAAIASAAAALAEAAGGDERGAADVLATSCRGASEPASLDPALRRLVLEADDVVERLHELQTDARRLASECVVDDPRLAAVEERLELVARVKRRYGSVDAALRALVEAGDAVESADGGPQRVFAEEERVGALRRRAGATAAELSGLRKRSASRLERAVTQQLRALALPHARVRVIISHVADPDGVEVDGEFLRCTQEGIDEVEIRMAADKDVLPAPLDEGPSGGELSRLALAVSAVVTDAEAPALVLDEVDAGIGGETAAAVGDVLAAIGRSRQVVAVTHRAEIAARAQHHLRVVKRQLAGGPEVEVRQLVAEERLHEIARLMSGRSTDAALRRADELLREGAGEQTGGDVGGARRVPVA